MPSRPLPPLPQRWFHSFEFPDGEQVEGIKPLASLREEADQIFSQPLAGRRVLDIGAWDGFFSFEAERRGAADTASCVADSRPGGGSNAHPARSRTQQLQA